jgi:type IV fimbrial biogenesis protein FimT
MVDAPHRHRLRGLTLIEIAIAIAVVAILATMAMPSLAERIARQRLMTTAETVAMDLAEARVEAVQSGLPLHLVFDGSSDWCYAVARSESCGCRTAQACQLKVVRGAETPGVSLVAAENARFDGSALPVQGGTVLLRGVGGHHQLQVSLSPLGRARLCSPTGLQGYAAC